MPKRKSVDYTELRKYTAKLYAGVLTKNLSVREALMQFPKNCEDKTIIAAWHALCHFEADEEIRAKDKQYAQEQDEYIESIYYTLIKGEELAQNIIDSYLPYYDYALISPDNSFKGLIYQLKKFLCC